MSGSTWTLQYTLTDANFVSPATAATATSGETGFEAITGQIAAGGLIRLYAVSYTAGDDNPNGLYEITDALNSTTGAGETFTELESAAGNGGQVFKGVSLAVVSGNQLLKQIEDDALQGVLSTNSSLHGGNKRIAGPIGDLSAQPLDSYSPEAPTWPARVESALRTSLRAVQTPQSSRRTPQRRPAAEKSAARSPPGSPARSLAPCGPRLLSSRSPRFRSLRVRAPVRTFVRAWMAGCIDRDPASIPTDWAQGSRGRRR